jgi:mRNA-degrading endonuclease RelE of RelBE toxin-antitoxin system
MNSEFLADAGYLVRNGIFSWAISTGNDLLKKSSNPKHSKKKRKEKKKKKIRLKCGEGDSRLIFGVRDERGRQNE